MKPHLLKAARKRQKWSRAKVAETLQIHPRTVFRWEQGQAMPPYYREQLCVLFGKTAQELGLTFDTDENDIVEQASSPLALPTAPDIPAAVVEDAGCPKPSPNGPCCAVQFSGRGYPDRGSVS